MTARRHREVLPNLVNGVSQQPAALRLASQFESVDNCVTSVVEGITKRPPTQHKAEISSTAFGDCHTHIINRDINTRYIVVIEDDNLRVFDLDGNEKTVNFPNGKGYLNASDPSSAFRAVTVADYTFITNREVTTAMRAAKTAYRAPQCILFFKQVAHEVAYNVTLDGNSGTYTAPSTGAVSTSTARAGMSTNLALPSVTYDESGYGPILWVKRDDDADFSVTMTDARGGTYSQVIKDSVQRFSDLPTVARLNYAVEVRGDNTSSFDNYWVKFVTNGGETMGEGVWVESTKPDILLGFDASTMPHQLVDNGDGTFDFSEVSWNDRTVGDEESAPEPSFIGNAINDVFFHKNRLGFLADDNVILSEAGEFFNFFPATVTALLDTAPIDIAASHNKVAILQHAVPHDERLLIFSDQTQFTLESDGILTPNSAGLDPSTEYASSLLARPIGNGSHVFFPIKNGSFAGIREFAVETEDSSDRAVDITAHVPQYIPGEVTGLSVAQNQDMLAVTCTGAPDALYIYKFFWSGTTKAQSSWTKWDFNGSTILSADFVESTLYLIIQRGSKVYVETVEVEPNQTDPNADYVTHLDRRIDDGDCTSITYSSATDETTFVLPYDITNGDSNVAIATRFVPITYETNVGVAAQITEVGVTAKTVKVRGDWSTYPVYIGEKYLSKMTFSEQFVKEEARGGGVGIANIPRITFRRWNFVFDKTGFFKVLIDYSHTDEVDEHIFTGRVLGSQENIIGSVPLVTDQTTVPVMGISTGTTISIESNSFLPMRFQSAGWFGLLSSHV